MTYQDDPASSLGEAVRFWLQDTGSPSLLSDNEIAYLIQATAQYSADPILIASVACSVVSSKYARMSTINIDGGSISGDSLAAKMTQLASDLRATYTRVNGSNAAPPFAGGIEFGDDYLRWGAKPHLFRIGMNDNGGYGLSESREDYNDGVLNGEYYQDT